MKNLAPVARASLCALAATAFAVSSYAADKIPITTSSEEARQLYLKGRDLVEKLRAADAGPFFEQAAAKDPSFALAQVGLANSAGTAKEFFAAIAKAVTLGEKASEPERLLICSLDAGAKAEPARQTECLTKLVQAVPDDERAHNQLAQALFGRQDYAAAIVEYKKATALNPQFSQPYNQMGYAFRFMGQYPEAEQAFKKYIELIPGDPNPYDSYAELLMKTGRFEESIKNYEKALAVDPNFVASYIGIGNDRVFMGQPEEARKSYAKLAAVARNDGEKLLAHFWTTMSYVHEGATDKAVAEVEKMAAIDQAGKDLVALSAAQKQMGDILIEAGRIDEAVKKYQEQVATIDKADAPAQVKETAHRQALFDEARVALARHDVAGAKAKAAAYASAVAAHKVPFEMRQTHELAGRIALEEKKPGVAVSELAQANQQDPRVLYLLAVAHQAAGDPVKAKLAGVQAADFNGLSNTYGYVRAKAKAMVTAPKKN
ncbi:MAG TPA: tetratricopeptide repeat protein [Vicinamibacteria bacterium]|nr:tetratricopeptide repeat protein [Vicinamibacteria bacterium]